MKPFKDRATAGQLLAKKLRDKNWENTTILALPRGGVPLAREIANELNLPWDILLVKKIGAPNQPEFAIGAMSEDEHPIWNQDSISWLQLPKKDLKQLADKTHQKILDQNRIWRKSSKALEVKDQTIILVDDGLATGMTMQAAVEFMLRREAKEILVATPVASKSAVESLRKKVDDVIVLHTPEPFFSVGQWYKNFDQITDEVVTNLLAEKFVDRETNIAVEIPVQKMKLAGNLLVPKNPKGIVIFAHGSGSSHKSPRNQLVAQALNDLGFSTLLFDLLTPEEALVRANVFNIPLLAKRLSVATKWIQKRGNFGTLSIGYFGASTGAAAAIVAASQNKSISSVVSRGGRPDMAGDSLKKINCPTLLIVGGNDHEVLELNRLANNYLNHGELAIVPGAGHLFEEAGTLDEVIEYAGDWFISTLADDPINLKTKPQEHIVHEITKLAHAIDSPESIKPLLEKLSQARVVMLGEATHGTEDFYELRKIISKQLIEEHGFNFIAVEGDWPNCIELNNYVQLRSGKSVEHIMGEFKRWPTWMWANKQVVDLIEWMKGRGAGFYGLDVYSLYESLDLIKSYASKLEPKLEKRIIEAYSCLEFFDRNEIEYAKTLLKWPNGCEKEILRNLREILRLRLEETNFDSHELYDFQQNAKIIRNAEKYYRSMMYGGADSWNIRDEHMIDTLDSLLRFYGDNSKAIVWAHNTHIGDYHATDMLSEGYVNLGGLAREKYGIENVKLVGFGTFEGEVLAGRAWEAPPEVMKLPSASKGTYEAYFHKVAEQIKTEKFFITMNGENALKLCKGHRAIGVVYRPENESHGRNYVPTELANRYDAFVFVDKTTALTALPVNFEKGILPESWPVGV